MNMWALKTFAPVEAGVMRTTDRLTDLVRDLIHRYRPEMRDQVFLRGRAAPFKRVKIIELSDGYDQKLPMSELAADDRNALIRETRSRWIRWMITPIVEAGHDPFPYNCEIIVRRSNA